LWRINGDDFLAALTETPLSAAAMSGMSTRLKRTHPSQHVAVPAQRDSADEEQIATPLSH
jgi:hypothetical protein